MTNASISAPAEVDSGCDRLDLLAGLPTEQLAGLRGAFRRRRFERGEILVREGDPADALYLLAEGRVEVVKTARAHRLAVLGPGDEFGAMALLEGSPRSATVRALEDGLTLVLTEEDVRRLAAASSPDLYLTLTRNLLRQQSRRLRQTNDRAVGALEKALEESEVRVRLGTFVTFVIVILSGYTLALRAASQIVAETRESTAVTVAVLAIAAGLVVAMIRSLGEPLARFGWNLDHWRRGLVESLAASALFCAFLVVVKASLLAWLPVFAGQPLFSLRGFAKYDLTTSLLIVAVYSLFVPAQEFIVRGALQGSLERFLAGPRVKAKAVLLATLVFASMHTHMSTSFALLSIAPSLLWGWLYARHGSLLGASVSHVVVGLWAAFVLGFPGLSY